MGDREAAEQVASAIRQHITKGEFKLPRTGPSFAALAEEWLAKYPVVRSIRPTTFENYCSFTRQHLIPFFGSLPVTEITTDTIENFIVAKRGPAGSTRFRGKPLSEQSLRIGLIVLRLILQRAVKARDLDANPAIAVGRFPTTDEETVDPFTGTELRAILATAYQINTDFGTFFRLWTQSGMRAGEISALQGQDLDLERGAAVVRRTWSRQRIGPTKTGRIRVVSFLHPIADETSDWRPGTTAGSRAVLTGLRRLSVRSLEPTAFVFGRGGPMKSHVLNREWRRVLMAAKVRYRSPEQLRHTFASTLLSRNAPLLYVQQQGGWKSAAVLLRVYARWMPQGELSATPAQPSVRPASVNADEIEDYKPLRTQAGTSRSS